MGENNDKNLGENNKKIKNIVKEHQMQCHICGSIFHKTNKNKHLKTKKHKDCEYVWVERFEIVR